MDFADYGKNYSEEIVDKIMACLWGKPSPCETCIHKRVCKFTDEKCEKCKHFKHCEN